MSNSASLSSANVETQRRFAHEVWNKQNIFVIPEFVADEYIGRDPAYSKPIRGPEGYADYVRSSLSTFPDLHLEQHAVLGDGDHVLSHYTVSGTQDGPLGPLPPTGR